MSPATRTQQPGAPASAAGTDLNKYLAIALADEVYGVEVMRVKEIIEYTEVTSMPMMPDFVRGSINLRGRGVPVVELGRRLGGAPAEVGKRTCIVIVEVQPAGARCFDVGLMVDAVNEVVDIAPADVEPPPDFGGRLRSEFTSGMAKRENGFLILLAIDRMLALDDLQEAVGA